MFNYHYDIEGVSRGAANQCRDIAAALRRLGHDVDVRFRNAKPENEPQESVKESLKKIGWLRKYGHAPKLLLRNFPLARQEKKIIDEVKPDVLFVVNFFCIISPLIAARKKNIPLVLFCDAPTEYEYSQYNKQYHSYPLLSRWAERKMIRGAQQVTCISDTLKGLLTPYGAPSSKVTTVSNGVDVNKFKPQSADTDLQTKYSLKGKTVVGFVGSFNFFTDVRAFAETIATVCRGSENAMFLFVGKGNEDREEFRREVEKLGVGNRLIFTGSVDHEAVPRYMSLMDVAIGPYRGDVLFYQSSMKLLEYMAAALPVLYPALGQIKEAVTDGYNGLLYRWDSLEEFRDKLQLLLSNSDLRHRLGTNARKTIETGWSWDLKAAEIARILTKAVQEFKSR